MYIFFDIFNIKTQYLSISRKIFSQKKIKKRITLILSIDFVRKLHK